MPDTGSAIKRAEAFAEVVQHYMVEMAAGLGCSHLLAVSYSATEKRLRGVVPYGFHDPALPKWQWTLSDFPAVERAIRTGQPVILSQPIDFPPSLLPHFQGQTIVLPLLLQERILGALIGKVETGTLPRSPAWQLKAREIAAQAVLVVELERVTTVYQGELKVRQSTREVAAAILEGRPLTEVVELILEIVGEHLQEKRVGLYLREEDGRTYPIALRNISEEYGFEAARVMPRSAMMARAYATGLPMHVRNVQTDPQFSHDRQELFQRENVTSLFISTLQYEDSIRGALVVYPMSNRSFTSAETAVFQSFADMATLAVAISRQLDQQSAFAMMTERNRLAGEIHDTVAQSLTGLLLQIETAQSLLESGSQEAARELLIVARTQAKKALEETRRAVQGLAPASLERLTPAQAIAEETKRLEQETGIPTQFILTGEEQELNPDQRAALLRIAQESLANAKRHSEAKRVRVGLQFGSDEVTLLVEDDGVGFDTTAPTAPGMEGGYGLFGMNERARMLDGDVQIESTPGWGTRIITRLPYRPASQLPRLENSTRRTTLVGREGTDNRNGEGTSPPPPSLHPTNKTIRVLVTDDHAVTRQGIRAMLETSGDIVVVGEAADGAEAVEQARTLRPDVVLMDLQMPGVGGQEGLRRLHAEQPDLPVVILTTFQTEDSVREALRGGAKGYLLKDTPPENLLRAIRAAQRGESLFSSEILDRLTSLTSPHPEGGLNEREMEIVRLLVQGARNKEIATKLSITPKTVEYHLSNIFSKLEVTNRTEAAHAARERGLVP